MNLFARRFALLALLCVLVGGCKSMTGETLGNQIDDTSITTWVKSTLVADKFSNLTRVHVHTVNGVVYLTGTVSTGEVRDRAADLARQVDGVKDVINHIELQN